MDGVRLTVIPELAPAFRDHKLAWAGCVRCEIGRLARKKVLVRGTLPCDVLFIGEAPGDTEDLTGEPFIGRAGRELDEWIQQAQLTLPDFNPRRLTGFITIPEPFTYAVTNTVACRPCDAAGGPFRQPTSQEQANCYDRFAEVCSLARPRGVVLLGRVASDWRDRFGWHWAYPALELLHPAAVLRAPGERLKAKKREEQVQKLSTFIAGLPGRKE